MQTQLCLGQMLSLVVGPLALFCPFSLRHLRKVSLTKFVWGKNEIRSESVFKLKSTKKLSGALILMIIKIIRKVSF